MLGVATEIALIYGNDLTIAANGDLLLSQDAIGNPEATFERVLRIVATNPTTRSPAGVPIGRPDDLLHPNFGSGIKQAIGEPALPALQAGVQARILAALQTDPYIATTPAPTVTWTALGVSTWQIIVSCTSILGLPFTLPSFALTPYGVVVGEV